MNAALEKLTKDKTKKYSEACKRIKVAPNCFLQLENLQYRTVYF